MEDRGAARCECWRCGRVELDADTCGEGADGVDEVAAACGLHIVGQRREEHGAVAVDEEAAWGIAVANDAVGAAAEQLVGGVVVGRDPAVSVADEPEVGEGAVELLDDAWEHVALVAVGEAGRRWRSGHGVPRIGRGGGGSASAVQQANERSCGTAPRQAAPRGA